MKPATTGALVLLISLSWNVWAVAFGSLSIIQRPLTYTPESPGSLAESTLTHEGITLHNSEKTLISWERRELSRSYKVNERNANERSLRSVIGIDTNNDGDASGRVIVHKDPKEDCGCKDDGLDSGGTSTLHNVKPRTGTF